MKSVKRTAESLFRVGCVCSAVRFADSKEPPSPSAKALGYSRSVRFADDEAMFLRPGRLK
jgi:hypothetical protein